jgi:hypothetical protein
MARSELAYFRQTFFAIRDWDGFQQALRAWAKLRRNMLPIADDVNPIHH